MIKLIHLIDMKAKIAIIFLFFPILANCQNTKDDTILIQATDTNFVANEYLTNELTEEDSLQWEDVASIYYTGLLREEFKEAYAYRVTDTIKIDLNGDKLEETVFFNKEKNIVIVDGKTKIETLAPNSSGDFDFEWVDYWGVIYEKETNMALFDKEYNLVGGKTVKLAYPSIVVRKFEVGGGVITFKKGKYVWLHQSC